MHQKATGQKKDAVRVHACACALSGRERHLAAALGVAEEDPLVAEVDHLVRGHLARVRAAPGKVHVLRGDLGAVGELDERGVERRGADVDVALGRVAGVDVGTARAQAWQMALGAHSRACRRLRIPPPRLSSVPRRVAQVPRRCLFHTRGVQGRRRHGQRRCAHISSGSCEALAGLHFLRTPRQRAPRQSGERGTGSR